MRWVSRLEPNPGAGRSCHIWSHRAVLLFWFDYRTFNDLNLASTSARCLSGHPPWWPPILPI
jgi:hypothetical protein